MAACHLLVRQNLPLGAIAKDILFYYLEYELRGILVHVDE